MKKLIFISVILIFFTGRAFCENSIYPPDIKRIKDRGEFVVAMYFNDIPPFFMHDENGNFYGLDVELARDIADKLGVKVRFDRKAKTFGEIVDMVVNHEADAAISLLSRTLKRAEKIRYTKPYIVLKQGLIINRLSFEKLTKNKSIINTLNQKQSVIAVKKGTSYVDFSHRIFPDAVIKEYPEWDPEIVDAVVSGEAAAGYDDEIEIKKYIISRPEAAIHVTTAVIEDLNDPIAIAVPYDSNSLLDWLNLYIDQHVKKITADTILDKYKKSLKQ